MLTIPALRWEGPFHRPKHPRQHLKTEDLVKSRVRVSTDVCNPLLSRWLVVSSHTALHIGM